MILICIKNNLDLTFIEIASPNKSNIISGCIYRYSEMDQIEFNHYCLNTLKKTVFLLGYFNVDLLRYEHHKVTD